MNELTRKLYDELRRVKSFLNAGERSRDFTYAAHSNDNGWFEQAFKSGIDSKIEESLGHIPQTTIKGVQMVKRGIIEENVQLLDLGLISLMGDLRYLS